MMRRQEVVMFGVTRQLGNTQVWTDFLGGSYATDDLVWAAGEPTMGQREFSILAAGRLELFDVLKSYYHTGGISVFCIGV